MLTAAASDLELEEFGELCDSLVEALSVCRDDAAGQVLRHEYGSMAIEWLRVASAANEPLDAPVQLLCAMVAAAGSIYLPNVAVCCLLS